MISKLQRIGISQILTATVFCIVLVAMPSGASENPTGSLKVGAIIDQPVLNAQGQELGDLEDLVIKRNGSVKKALISVAGFLDVGEKLVSVKYKLLKIADGKIILDATRKQLEDQPEFDYRKNDLFTNYTYRLYPYYGMMPGPYGTYDRGTFPGYRQRWSDEGVQVPHSGPQGEGDQEQPYDRPYSRYRGEGRPGMRNRHHPWSWAYYPAQMLASVILGQEVVNKQGEEVATVEDLTIGTAGKVDRLILSYGGFLDIGNRLVAVPFRSIGFTNRGITYDITRREIENLPRFNK
jgi:sporulation protein YlmC with PRC-barrel domain